MSQSKQENGSFSISEEGKGLNYNPELELAEAIEEFELMANVDGRSEKTMDLYDYVFGRFTDFLSEEITIGSISTKQIRKYLAELIEEDLKRTTVAIHHRVLNAFFTWLVEEGFLKKSPTEKVDEPKTPDKHPKVLSKEQVEKLVQAA
ncbi:phage integrase N-terminal SAM-like domain-containing protein, partial [Candidatus Bipolaricaulota bacterium]|nr:phage integrase N-terminal SAM-like domain-containing protein [Candidatus Bipolaricaulota bacterium]